jgi:hypothetical protein
MIVLPLGNGQFLPYPFQFIVHVPAIHSTLYNPAGEAIVKYAMKVVIL